MKTWKFLGAPLMLMLLAGMPWCVASAEGDQTGPVVVEAGENRTVGNVTVNNSENAVSVVAQNTEEKQGDASVTVNGNVQLQNSYTGPAVEAKSVDGNAVATINGDISASTTCVARGVNAENSAESDTISTTVNVSGGVLSTSQRTVAYGVQSTNSDITIGKDIEANGPTARGLVINANKKTNVSIAGGVLTNGQTVSGVTLNTDESDGTSGDISLTIGNGIVATATSENDDDYTRSGCISLSNNGGKIRADINGDVTATAPNGAATGIATSRHVEEGHPFGEGPNDILIHGNLTSDGVGIFADTVGENTKINVLVEETLKAKDVGVLLEERWWGSVNGDVEVTRGIPTTPSPEQSLYLTVWKIELNERGNVAEQRVQVLGDTDDEFISADGSRRTAKDYEKKIMYIIKVEQPSEGGTITAVDENGNALPKSFNFDVAHENEKVMLKANLADGYKIVAAYNGKGEKQPLLKDENGNYYIIIPKGGGVYLSVELEYTTEHSYSEPEDNEEKTVKDEANETAAKEETKDNDAEEELAVSLALPDVSQSYTQSVAPKTGDETQITPWLILSVVSIGGIAGMEICNKKAKRKSTN